jgi:non-specific serine/threonine protein kinase
MIGQTVSHYEILEQLGAGGMGVVYKARDMRLGREVALKLLPPQFSNEETKERFQREARAASALDHPAICTIHDVGQTADGSLYIVMGYYPGETLKELIGRGPLQMSEAVRIARAIAEGLAAAHELGIVHRDIKPANVQITARGDVKILDFGLAKVAGSADMTQTGTTVGTLTYMSPEQLMGHEIDARTDVWSFGALLYELVTGSSAFGGNHEGEVVYALLHRDVPLASQSRPEVPSHLDRLISDCLRRKLENRLGSIREALDRLEETKTGPAPEDAPTRAREVPTVLAEAPTVVRPAPTDEPEPKPEIAEALAVLDLVNISGDPGADWLGGGIAESVTVDISKLSDLKVVSRGTIVQSLKAQGGPPRDESAALEIGTGLSTRWVAWGGFQKVGDEIRITAHLLDATSGETLESIKLDGSFGEIFALQDRLVEGLAHGLDVVLSTSRQRQAAEPRTDDLEAYEYCARGRQLIFEMTPEAFLGAREALERAIELDPDYALAYSGLGSMFAMRYIATTDPADLENAIQNLLRATELDPELGDPYIWLTYCLARQEQFDDAINAGKRGAELEPDNFMAHYALGVAYWLQAMLGFVRDARLEAIPELGRTIELAPRYQPARQVKADLLAQYGRYEAALDLYREAVALEEDEYVEGARFVGSHGGVAVLHLKRGELDEAVEWARRSLSVLAETEHIYADACEVLTRVTLGEIAFRHKRFDEAARMFREAVDVAHAHNTALGIGWFRVRAGIGLAKALWLLGMRKESDAALERARTIVEHRQGYDFSGIWDGGEMAAQYDFAALHAAANRAEAAREALQRALECGWCQPEMLATDPAFTGLLRTGHLDEVIDAAKAELARVEAHLS